MKTPTNNQDTPQNEDNKINRQEALKKIAVIGTAAYLAPQWLIGQEQPTYKIAIEGGKVFTNNELKKDLFVGITWDNKIKLSDKPLKAAKSIDATGKIVSPGLVDILADNAANPKMTYKIFEKYKVSDGLTTVLQLHGGAESPALFHQYFDKQPHHVNYGVGIFVMLIRLKYATLATRYKMVEKGLEEGGLAVAHSLEYQPDTSYAEVKEYAKLAKKYDRPLFLHLRYSSEKDELKGVKEAIQLAQETGARVHIDHLHSTGGTYQMPKALELIQNANFAGSEITCCVYPYSYWATYIVSERFSGDWQGRYGITYQDLTIVGTGERLSAATFPAYRKRYGVLVAVPEGTMPFEKTSNLALQTDFCMFGSDGGIESEPRANSHPRGAGFAATAIRHGLDIGLSLEKTLTKLTTLPARLMRPALNQRADIKDGYHADITIFDPKTIRGRATVANPNQFSAGIEYVIVNGEIAYQNQQLLKANGKPIRY